MAIQWNSNFDGTMPFSDVCAQVSVAVGVAQTWTIPGASTVKYQAYFSYTQDANVFVCKNAVPVVPASGSVGTQQYGEFRPDKRYVQGGDVLQFITPDSIQYFGVSLRQLPG